MFQAREKLFKYFARVADQSGVHLHVLIDLGAVDFDVNLARVLGIGAQIAGDAIVKAHANGDEQVGFLDRVIDPSFAVHSHHAEVKRVAGREAADAEERHSDRKIAGMDELVEHAHRAGNHDAVTGKNQRTLGGVEQLDGALKLRLFVVGALALWGKLWSGSFPVEIAGGLLCVLGDIDEDGAGPAGIGDQESFTNRAGYVFGAGNDDVVLGDRHGDAGDIDFLEGIGAEELAADLSGDANHWRGGEHGGRDARDHVSCAGAGGGHSHAYAAAGSRIAVGHVGGALFVAHEDVVQLGFAKRVVHGKNR